MSELKTKGSPSPKGSDYIQKSGCKRKITHAKGGAAGKKTAGRSLFGLVAHNLHGAVIVKRDAMGQFVVVSKAYVQARPPDVLRSDTRTVRTKKTIWSALDEIWAEVPDEELRKLPVDLAAQHDHYVYGLPKKAQ